MRKKWLILLAAFGMIAGAGAVEEMIPTPKSCRVGQGRLDFNTGFRVVGDCAAADWLRTDLAKNLTRNPGEETLIEFKSSAFANPEAYRLVIAERRIELYAAAGAGFFRVAGRLLALLEIGNGVLPPLEITDEPDFPIRGMHLQMPYQEPFSRQARYRMIEQMLDAMARLGFNYAVFELGGNFQSEHHRSHLKNPWNADELSALVRYGKARGITVIPGINTIGHMDRAPQLFPLKDAKGLVVGMDIRNPAFFPAYIAVVDDLLDIFDHPPFIHLGSDESQAAWAQLADTPAAGAELFAGLFNRIDQHLQTRSCRPVIWHDMLFAKLAPGETANGEKTAGARAGLSRNIIVDYWCYDALPRYTGVETLRREGFEVWVSPWFQSSAAKLTADAKVLKAAGMLGTTWKSPYQAGDAVVVAAAYGWNVKSAFPEDPGRFFARLANRLPPLPRTVGSPFEVKTVNAPARILELARPDEITRLKKSNPAAAVLVQGALSEKEMLLIKNINVPRPANSVVIFTASYGKSTNTNRYGDEWPVANGLAGKKTVNLGNTAIPADGAVISVHGSGNERQHWLGENLKPGKRAKFLALLPENNAEETITLPLSGELAGFQFPFSAQCSFVGENEPAMVVTVRFKDGASEAMVLKTDFQQRLEPTDGNFRVAPQTRDTYLLRWTNSSGKPVEAVTVKLTATGVLQGMKLERGIVF